MEWANKNSQINHRGSTKSKSTVHLTPPHTQRPVHPLLALEFLQLDILAPPPRVITLFIRSIALITHVRGIGIPEKVRVKNDGVTQPRLVLFGRQCLDSSGHARWPELRGMPQRGHDLL